MLSRCTFCNSQSGSQFEGAWAFTGDAQYPTASFLIQKSGWLARDMWCHSISLIAIICDFLPMFIFLSKYSAYLDNFPGYVELVIEMWNNNLDFDHILIFFPVNIDIGRYFVRNYYIPCRDLLQVSCWAYHSWIWLTTLSTLLAS